ncbi:hypothetical protein COO60DRAFT_599487 [Scenedesmus sp. NREL 46B-D3]|nr:hypothetical protein COO60DRAFT_599487 [Scenedesmus sp. NREL 46B-D3]
MPAVHYHLGSVWCVSACFMTALAKLNSYHLYSCLLAVGKKRDKKENFFASTTLQSVSAVCSAHQCTYEQVVKTVLGCWRYFECPMKMGRAFAFGLWCLYQYVTKNCICVLEHCCRSSKCHQFGRSHCSKCWRYCSSRSPPLGKAIPAYCQHLSIPIIILLPIQAIAYLKHQKMRLKRVACQASDRQQQC